MTVAADLSSSDGHLGVHCLPSPNFSILHILLPHLKPSNNRIAFQPFTLIALYARKCLHQHNHHQHNHRQQQQEQINIRSPFSFAHSSSVSLIILEAVEEEAAAAAALPSSG
ncbi:hypothetical protein TYRP_005037 [Tyrophagus putrescentiae]|nr:hypothetical protein TYRP_005037 [Tyrophagus putrescentiae]